MSNEIISIAQMRAIDDACAATIPSRSLMDNAARAVADAIDARLPRNKAIAVVCGPGNNGGDGWAAARTLLDRGWSVWVETLVPIEQLKGDAHAMAMRWSGETFAAGKSTFKADFYVDAMFGAGLSRPLEGQAAQYAAIFADAPERVVAVDVPSGLAGDSAKPIGEVCARAGLTVTFVRKKPAHVLLPGRDLCGEVIVADIGASDEIVAAQDVKLRENGPAIWHASFPWPSREAHKHQRGHAFVASGEHLHTGAARLAARSALRVGAGLVTVLSPSSACDENAAQLSAIMLQEAKSADDYQAAAEDAQCLVIGPAFGVEARHADALKAALNSAKRCALVLDADAITLLAPIKHGVLRPTDVMTPHLGEFRRAFPGTLEASTTRVEAAQKAASLAGCIVVLKGPDTVIAAPDGRAVVNTTGTPFLATAGSGDVLAGLIGGLIGQGMPSLEAACAAAWLHGRAAESHGAGLTAEDIPEILPPLLNALAPEAWKRRPLG